MPGFAHIIISLLLSGFLIKFSQGKFTYRHAIIFSINSHFGPDAFGWMPWVGPGSEIYYFIHGYGWIFVAFLIALPWTYFNNLDLHWKPKIHVTRKEVGNTDILPYLQVYCLVAAGGIFHQFIDLIGHPPTIHYEEVGNIVNWGGVWFGGDTWFNIDWVLATGAFPCGNTFGFTAAVIVMVVVPIFMIYFILLKIPSNNGKNYMKFAIILSLIYFIPLTIAYAIPDPINFILNDPIALANYTGDVNGHFGSAFYLTGGESDFGILIYMFLFFFVPILFLYWGTYGIPKFKKRKKRVKVKTTVEVAIKNTQNVPKEKKD